MTKPKVKGNWPLWFLLAPFIGLLYPPFYAKITPRLLGLPFFVWYQFAWVILGALIIGLVYLIQNLLRNEQ